jgi:hypothetical protein
MLLALSAVSSALDALQSLAPSKSSSAPLTGFGQGSTASFDVGGSAGSATGSPSTGFSQISPETMSALIAAQSQSGATSSASTDPSSALKDLFSQIDNNGDGQITKSEFENALGAGGTNLAQADDVFNKLDTNGDGTVSLDELSKALKGTGHGGHHHHAEGSGDAGSSTDASGSNTDPLAQALAGASSNSVTNTDGSTTTSITYADGSKVTLTTPAASTASSSATSSYNLIEQLMQREAQALSASGTSSLSIAA